MSLLGGNGSVFYALGYDKYFARPQRYYFVSKLDVDSATEHQEEIIRIIVLVPNKLALYFDHH